MTPWEQILDYLRESVSPQNYATWLKPARMSHVNGTVLFIQVPNETFRTWYTQNCATMLEDALQHLELGIDRIELVCSQEAAKDNLPRQRQLDFDSPAGQLNPRFTFETFVPAPSNQFAHAAADRVAREPSHAYNPLFLYGGNGMGKTHLLQAIGHGLAHRRLRLRYTTTHQFLQEVINSIRYDRIPSFHDRYRNLDVLLVDDVYLLSGKERTQEEMFHIFNALYEAQKQMVFTSDRPPNEIPQLEERLRTRFEWGLMADIQPPDLETRMAILMKKAELQGVALPDEIALLIASKIQSNIRELEGCLTRILAYSSLTGAEISVGMAQHVLKGMLAAQERKVNIEAIQQVVAEEFKLRISDLKSRNNSRTIVYPRQVAMFLCRQLAGASLPEIGRAFGGKHHTTVLHSIEKIGLARSSDRELNRLINKLSDSLR